MTERQSSPPLLHDAGTPNTAKGQLSIQVCTACGHHPNFPRVRCPSCFGEVTWRPSNGKGVITSVAIIRKSHRQKYDPFLPIVMAHVRLEEGVEFVSTIVGSRRLKAKIGDEVEVAAHENWSELPQFQRCSD